MALNKCTNGTKIAKEQKRAHAVLFIADLAITILCYASMFRPSFGSDTLFHIYRPLVSIDSFISDGRLAAWALNRVLYCCGFITTDHYYICLIVFLGSWAACILHVQQMFLSLDDVGGSACRTASSTNGYFIKFIYKFLVLLVPVLAFLNVFSMEYFMFPECWLVFPFGYYFATFGTKLLSKGQFISGLIWTAVGCMFYQPAGITAAILLGSWWAIADRMVFRRKLLLKEILYSVYVVGICAAGLGFINLLASAGVWPSSHKADTFAAMDFSNIRLILSELQHGWWKIFRDNRDLLPARWICAILWLFALGGIIFYFIRHREWKRIITLFLLQLMYFLLISAYPIASGSWFPRIIFPFYMALCMTMMAFVILVLEIPCKHAQLVLHISVAGAFLVLQMVICNLIGSERHVSNTVDVESARTILRQIEWDETENGTKVTKLATCIDANCNRYYSFLRWHTDQINEKTMAVVPYSLMHMVAGEEGRVFEQTTVPDDVYQEYFAGKDWDTLTPDQQVVVLGDTAYWCIY